jgi:ATP-binding cassette subfamily B protein
MRTTVARLRDSIPERPASRDIRQLARILGFLAPYRRQMAIAMVGLVVAAACVLVLGQGLRRVIDRGFSGADAALLDSALFALLAVIVVMAIATYTRFYYVSGSASASPPISAAPVFATCSICRRVFSR